jgi:hypothetical protein
MARLTLSIVAVGMALCVRPIAGQECGMSRAFMQPDGNAPTGATAVWSDPKGTALLFIESLNVNTDGTRRSYSVDDFWGEKVALNNLCNAMSDACGGLDAEGLRARRIVTQKAHAGGWPADLLKQTRISPSIIPFKGNKPCPDVDGFLVSATALHKPNVPDACDIANYVDALTVPALVLPGKLKGKPSGFTARGAGKGDLAVAVAVRPDQQATTVFAVVGDTGPGGQLGEASVALNGKLLGKTAPPKNYNEVRGRGEFKGQSWVVKRAIVLVFPKTHDAQNPHMTVERIDADTKRLFDDWGGIARLRACAAAYAKP